MQDEERKEKKKTTHNKTPNARVIHWSTFQEVTK